MATVRNCLDFRQERIRAGVSAIFLCTFFYLSVLDEPCVALAENGSLGASSTGSSEITIVIPEQIMPLEFWVENGKFNTCAVADPEVQFLSISNGNVNKLVMDDKKGATDCRLGELFHSLSAAGPTAILVPSSGS